MIFELGYFGVTDFRWIRIWVYGKPGRLKFVCRNGWIFFVIYVCDLSDFRQRWMPGNEIVNWQGINFLVSII